MIILVLGPGNGGYSGAISRNRKYKTVLDPNNGMNALWASWVNAVRWQRGSSWRCRFVTDCMEWRLHARRKRRIPGVVKASAGRGFLREVECEEGQEVNGGASKRGCRKMSSENSGRQAGQEHWSCVKCCRKVTEEEHSTRDRRHCHWRKGGQARCEGSLCRSLHQVLFPGEGKSNTVAMMVYLPK